MKQLSEQAINEFKEIYKNKFNKDLTNEEANRLGYELLSFFSLIYKPITKNEVDNQ